MTRSFRLAAFAALALAPAAALAHTGALPHDHGGFATGLLHPLSGADHLAAMVGVGLWAAVIGGRALWAVPASFVALLVAGALIGAAGWALPAVEPMIGLSVAALGLAAAMRITVPAGAAAALVGLFAVFHGHAHGAEMPAAADGLAYGLGFVAATAVLHGLGLVVGTRLGARVPRIAGEAVAAFGLLLLVAA
jgi:urease accessory protein